MVYFVATVFALLGFVVAASLTFTNLQGVMLIVVGASPLVCLGVLLFFAAFSSR